MMIIVETGYTVKNTRCFVVLTSFLFMYVYLFILLVITPKIIILHRNFLNNFFFTKLSLLVNQSCM